MLLIAAAIDGLQWLFTLSVVMTPLSWMLSVMSVSGFTLWFALIGVNYLKDGGKKLLLMLASGVVEFIPVINALPAVVVSVLGTIVMTRIEDARREIRKTVTSPRTAYAAGRLERMRAAQGVQGPVAARVPQGARRFASTVAKVVPAARAVTTVASVARAVPRPARPTSNSQSQQERANEPA